MATLVTVIAKVAIEEKFVVTLVLVVSHHTAKPANAQYQWTARREMLLVAKVAFDYAVGTICVTVSLLKAEAALYSLLKALLIRVKVARKGDDSKVGIARGRTGLRVRIVAVTVALSLAACFACRVSLVVGCTY